MYRPLLKRKTQHGQLRGVSHTESARVYKTTFMEETANRLSYIMRLADVTKSDLARRAGISRRELYRILAVENIISLPSAVNICKALGIKLNSLIYDKAFIVPYEYALRPNVYEFTYEENDEDIFVFPPGDARIAGRNNIVPLDTFRLYLSNELNRIRNDGRASQQYLATSSLVPISAMSRYTNIWQIPSLERVVNMCYALGETIADVVPATRFVRANYDLREEIGYGKDKSIDL